MTSKYTEPSIHDNKIFFWAKLHQMFSSFIQTEIPSYIRGAFLCDFGIKITHYKRHFFCRSQGFWYVLEKLSIAVISLSAVGVYVWIKFMFTDRRNIQYAT